MRRAERAPAEPKKRPRRSAPASPREAWRVMWRAARRVRREGFANVARAVGDVEVLEATMLRAASRAEGDALEVRARVAESTQHGMIFRLGWLDGERVLAAADDARRCP